MTNEELKEAVIVSSTNVKQIFEILKELKETIECRVTRDSASIIAHDAATAIMTAHTTALHRKDSTPPKPMGYWGNLSEKQRTAIVSVAVSLVAAVTTAITTYASTAG